MADKTNFISAGLACHGLMVYGGLQRWEIFAAFMEIIDQLNAQTSDPYRLLSGYSRLFMLLTAAEPAEDLWREHLLRAVLNDDNPFTRLAAGGKEIPPGLRLAVQNDLRLLQRIFDFDFSAVEDKISEEAGKRVSFPAWSGWSGGGALQSENERQIMQAFCIAPDWGELLPALEEFHRREGQGIFRRFLCFRWDQKSAGLAGIPYIDPIRLDDLIGYAEQKALILRNTEQFLAGLPANNLLLYGERGTGKSSAIKALAHEFGGRGLRLVEMSKHDLGDFPRLTEAVYQSPARFILYLDDLSFDESETGYKELKAILEGGLEAKPPNLLLYATSNRRHLIRERFSDQDFSDEIHVADTREEKLSLADRFGITITFLTPDQEGYLAIVQALAAKRGLAVSGEELRHRALIWERRQNGRSGRSARQFVDQLEGEMRMGK
ncbi:MAG: ATP-binding protein [Bacillota bacterium]